MSSFCFCPATKIQLLLLLSFSSPFFSLRLARRSSCAPLFRIPLGCPRLLYTLLFSHGTFEFFFRPYQPPAGPPACHGCVNSAGCYAAATYFHHFWRDSKADGRPHGWHCYHLWKVNGYHSSEVCAGLPFFSIKLSRLQSTSTQKITTAKSSRGLLPIPHPRSRKYSAVLFKRTEQTSSGPSTAFQTSMAAALSAAKTTASTFLKRNMLRRSSLRFVRKRIFLFHQRQQHGGKLRNWYQCGITRHVNPDPTTNVDR